MSEFYIFECPHCHGTVIVMKNELNCRIFRHGIYKDGNQLPPHSPKELCDKFVEDKENFGCGKPFKIIGENENVKIEPCDYI